jgi:spermidine synthase
MTIDFQELSYRETPFGELVLRRRTEVSLGVEVYEVKLGDEFLMSSLFTGSEIALASRALTRLTAPSIDVVVAGLGLGYTARAVLEHSVVRSLLVVEALKDVIDWHLTGLVPLGAELTSDSRCRFVNADFFAMADSDDIDSASPGRRFDAILVDIDHSPRHVLRPANATLYTRHGLKRLARHLQPGGVFGLWSNDPPDSAFQAELDAVFALAEAHIVKFPNPLLGREAACTVYLGCTVDPGVVLSSSSSTEPRNG